MKLPILPFLFLLSVSPICFAFRFPWSSGQPVQPEQNVVNIPSVSPPGVNFWEGNLKYKMIEKQLTFMPLIPGHTLEGIQYQYIQTLSPINATLVNLKTEVSNFTFVSYNPVSSPSPNISQEIEVTDEARKMVSTHTDIIIDEKGAMEGIRMPRNTSEPNQNFKKMMAYLFILNPDYLQNVHGQSRTRIPFKTYEQSMFGLCPTTYVAYPVNSDTGVTPSEEFLSEKVDQFCNQTDQFVVTKEINIKHCKNGSKPIDILIPEFMKPYPDNSYLASYYLMCGLDRRADTGRFASFRILKIYREARIYPSGAVVFDTTEVTLLSIQRPQKKQCSCK